MSIPRELVRTVTGFSRHGIFLCMFVWCSGSEQQSCSLSVLNVTISISMPSMGGLGGGGPSYNIWPCHRPCAPDEGMLFAMHKNIVSVLML